MDFNRSENLNQEKESLTREIRELKELVNKNSLLIEEIQKAREQAPSSSQEGSIRQETRTQEIVNKYESLVSKLVNLEETIDQNKQETLSEYQKFIKSGSQLDYKDTFEQFKDPLPLVEERLTKKLLLMNKTQEETRKQINTLTEALDMLGNGMEELHKEINKRTPTIPPSHSVSADNKQLIHELVISLDEFKLGVQEQIDKIVRDKFSAISSLLATVTTKTEEINKILVEFEAQPPSHEEGQEKIENLEQKDTSTNQW